MVDIESRSRAKKIANTRNLAAFANDTKWSEFFTEVCEQEILVEVKFIDSEFLAKESRVWVPAPNYIEGFQIGPELFVFIEWVRSRSTEKLAKIALRVGLEYVVTDSTITVLGYK
jgi:hypothetical protein